MKTLVSTWERELEALHERLAVNFSRSESRERSLSYLKGLLSSVERKNGWQLAEWMGESTPHGVQYLLDRARGVLIARAMCCDSTWSNSWAGVTRCWSWMRPALSRRASTQPVSSASTAGLPGASRTAKLACSSAMPGDGGTAFIDRELYLPKSWTDDSQRCKAAGIAETVKFETNLNWPDRC